MVHGVEHRGVAHPLADPKLDADAGVEEQHGCQGEQEEGHHDEGGVRLPVSHRAPPLLAAHVVVVVQKVVLHLREKEREEVFELIYHYKKILFANRYVPGHNPV